MCYWVDVGVFRCGNAGVCFKVSPSKSEYESFTQISPGESVEKINTKTTRFLTSSHSSNSFRQRFLTVWCFVNCRWSVARCEAFEVKESSPNAYYYRFNRTGEKQKLGIWSQDETALFLKKLKKHNIHGLWGLLSMDIPGRVGYQCGKHFR